jgi:hypothetical protein
MADRKITPRKLMQYLLKMSDLDKPIKFELVVIDGKDNQKSLDYVPESAMIGDSGGEVIMYQFDRKLSIQYIKNR